MYNLIKISINIKVEYNQIMKKVLICLILGSLIFVPIASAKKPSFGFINARIHEGVVTVYFSVSKNTDIKSIRVVHCLNGLEKNPIRCKKGKKTVRKTAPKTCIMSQCYRSVGFFAIKGPDVGYIIASSSDGTVKKAWKGKPLFDSLNEN